MHITEAERILRDADKATEAELRLQVRRLAEAYLFRLNRPTYTLTREQLARAFTSPGCDCSWFA